MRARSCDLLFLLAVFCRGSESAGVPQAAANDLAPRLLELLTAKCAACHSPQAEKIGGSLDFVLDLARLATDEKFVVPGQAEESELFLIVDEEQMPPKKNELKPLEQAEKDLIRAWIEAGAPAIGAPAADGEAPAPAPPKPTVTWERLVTWVGNFHMPSVHFPIALLMAAFLAEILLLRTKRESLATVVRFCLWVGFLSAIPAVVFGLARAEYGVFVGETEKWTLHWHKYLGLITLGWALVTALLVEARERWNGPVSRFLLRASLLTAFILAGATGTFGGALLYGWKHYAW